MIMKEYRIVLPFSVEEFKIGHTYMINKTSKQESVPGQGVQIITSEPFDNGKEKGHFLHRTFHLETLILGTLPAWARKLIPGSKLKIEEKTWNMYPYLRTIYYCPALGNRFSMEVESRYVADRGESENVHDLPPEKLKIRAVEHIDIALDIDKKHYSKDEDPQLFHSQKTGRGPLLSGWKNTVQPYMCAYKLVTVNFNMMGLRTKVENLIHQLMRNIYLVAHRRAFCWMDEWIDLSEEDVRKMEEEVKASLGELYKAPRTTGERIRQYLSETPTIGRLFTAKL